MQGGREPTQCVNVFTSAEEVFLNVGPGVQTLLCMSHCVVCLLMILGVLEDFSHASLWCFCGVWRRRGEQCKRITYEPVLNNILYAMQAAHKSSFFSHWRKFGWINTILSTNTFIFKCLCVLTLAMSWRQCYKWDMRAKVYVTGSMQQHLQDMFFHFHLLSNWQTRKWQCEEPPPPLLLSYQSKSWFWRC